MKEMEVQRFTEHYLADALRLASHFAERYNGTLSEGIGDAGIFPFPPKEIVNIDDARFVRVDGDGFNAEIAFVSSQEPKPGDAKIRNRSLYRVLVGEEIRRVRMEKGMTLERLSELSGLRAHSLQRIEEGRWDMDIRQLGWILEALGVTIKLG